MRGFGVVFAAAILAAAAVYGTLAPAGKGDAVEVEIATGMSGAAIGRHLSGQGVIRSAFAFRVVAALAGYDRQFKAGTHRVNPALPAWEIARSLTTEPPVPPDVRVTVPEGLTIKEIAGLVATVAGVDSEAFVLFAENSAFAQSLGIPETTLEGYLFPDTYYIRKGAKADAVLGRMTARFREVFTDSLTQRAAALGMTRHEVVTLASIIELETALADERPLVSSVFHRRLERGLPLQANATVQYALGEKRRVYDGDLDVQSPYNTYIRKGLPPGPVGNPGRESIVAALYPADSKYLYFVADGSGGHRFSATLDEHNRAVRDYKVQRRAQSGEK